MARTITEVRLLNVPLENDYQHTFYFKDRDAQTNYFKGRTIFSGADFNYQRKDNVIRYPMQFDMLEGCNYVMYQNSYYTAKWFYAFITKMEYVSDGLTDIYIETDVMQTWMFDYEVKASFIEREHVNDDTIGKHTVPEQVELGEYTCNQHKKADYAGTKDMKIIVGVTQNPNGSYARGKLYNNTYSGVNYYAFPHTFNGSTALRDWLDGYAEDGANDAVTCMFLAPSRLIQTMEDGRTIVESSQVDQEEINTGTSNAKIMLFSDGTIDKYTPKNNKLLTFPYRYLLVSNNAGCSVPLYYEEFRNSSNKIIEPSFRITGCLTPGCSIRMLPLNYKGIFQNDEEGINLGKFPCLNWTSDVYTNWLTQNAVNIGVNVAGNTMQIIGGAVGLATGLGAIGGLGSMANGILGVAGSLGEVYSHSLQPPQSSGNLNSGDVITADGTNDFHFYDMSIRWEYAQIIDEYFDMYGYKVNRLKVPNVDHRESFWYTKTINVNIVGVLPNDDLNKIKQCYNNGITFWSNHAAIKNYNVLNTIK